jgi:hypothetical protein
MAAKKRVKAKSKTRGASKRATARTSPRKAAPTPTALPDASAKTRAAILAGIRRVLKEHGVKEDLAELHLETTTAARATTTAARAFTPCPPGTILRVVCFRQADGTLVCEERCVPL